MKDHIENRKEKFDKRIKKTLEENKVLTKYYKHLSNQEKLSTISNYLFYVGMFCKYINKDLKKTTSEDINGFLGQYVQANRNTTAKFCYSSLLSYFRYVEGMSNKEYPQIFKNVKAPKVDIKNTKPLEYKDIKKMISVWGNDIRNKAIVHVLYESMLRKMEFLSLRVKDVDLTKSPAPVTIRISKTARGTNGRVVLLYNSIPILKEYLNVHPLKSHKDFEEMPLFVTRTGKTLNEGTLRLILREAAERAGIKRKVYPHLFRHSRAYELARYYHFAPQELMKCGGWTRSTMLDVYYQPQEKDIENKLLDGHGIKTKSQKDIEEELKQRKVGICACGYENAHDTIFCKGCGIILNIKEYQKSIKNKDTKIEDLEETMKNQNEKMNKILTILENKKILL